MCVHPSRCSSWLDGPGCSDLPAQSINGLYLRLTAHSSRLSANTSGAAAVWISRQRRLCVGITATSTWNCTRIKKEEKKSKCRYVAWKLSTAKVLWCGCYGNYDRNRRASARKWNVLNCYLGAERDFMVRIDGLSEWLHQDVSQTVCTFSEWILWLCVCVDLCAYRVGLCEQSGYGGA